MQERRQIKAMCHWRTWSNEYELVLVYRDDVTRKLHYAKKIEWVEVEEGVTPDSFIDEVLFLSEDDVQYLVASLANTPAMGTREMPEVVKAKDEHITDLRIGLNRADYRERRGEGDDRDER